jgi:hypothetical protein
MEGFAAPCGSAAKVPKHIAKACTHLRDSPPNAERLLVQEGTPTVEKIDTDVNPVG